MLRGSEQLAASVNYLEFENKGLIEKLKAEKKKKNKGKRLNLLGEEDDGPQLFSPSRVQAARNFAAKKEAEKEHQEKDAKKKKNEQQQKKAQEEINKKTQAHRENICRADPGGGSTIHPIHIDPLPSTPDPVLSTRHGSTGTLIYSRALSLDI